MLFCFSLFPSLCLTSTLSAAPLSLSSLVVSSTAIQAVASEIFFFFFTVAPGGTRGSSKATRRAESRASGVQRRPRTRRPPAGPAVSGSKTTP